MKSKINDILIRDKESILHAMKQMDRVGRKLLIVMKDNLFHSLVSIGDIQRAIISNKSLDTPVYRIVRQQISVGKSGDDLSILKQKMIHRKNEIMPIISDSNELLDVIFWEDIFDEDTIAVFPQMNLPVVIMAGGQGTRLKPLTNVLPKPLIPIREKTIIEEIMDKFLAYGCNRFYISVNYKAELIKHYFELLDNSKYIIEYFQETKPLGTAGSLSLIKDKISSTFFVSNCDILIDQDFSEILSYHKESSNEMTIVAAMKSYSIPYGTISTRENGLLESISEKPDLTFKINTGFYIIEPQLLHDIPDNQLFHITSLIDQLLRQKRKVGIFPVSEKSWSDIGSWEMYLQQSNIQNNEKNHF